MYTVIGADGRQYGPAEAGQIRAWLAEGRVNANTSVLPEGGSEWKPLSSFPEFATASGSSVDPRSGTAAKAEAFADEIRAADYTLSIGSCFSRGWGLVMSRFWLSVGASFVIFLLAWIAGSSFVLGLLVSYVLYGGLDWMFLRMVRGQRATFEDAFAGFSQAFVPLMLFSVVSQTLILIGALFCLLPGIYLSIAWVLFTPLLIMDKGFDFWPSMEVSRRVVNRHFWKLLLFAIVSALVLVAGLLCFVVGFFIALPVVIAATVCAYEDIFGSRKPDVAPVPTGSAPSQLAPLPESTSTTSNQESSHV
jgi:hypothetical protein